MNETAGRCRPRRAVAPGASARTSPVHGPPRAALAIIDIKYIMWPLMASMKDDEMRQLPVPMTAHDAALAPAELLAQVPEEGVWLANFPSPRTRATYRNAVAEFIGFLGLRSPQELYRLEQAHVIAWREELTRQGASARTISNRLSALSSLYKHLCEKQLCTENPVAGVKRPKVASQTVETAALSPVQVRAIVSIAPAINGQQPGLSH